MLTFSVTETTTFSLEEIQSSFGCFYTLDPIPSQTITIGATGITPSTASLSACDNGNGQATFDLTSIDNTVNGGSGETVLWFEDVDGNTPIDAPNSFEAGDLTVYAALFIAGCVSETVEVNLSVSALPIISINLDQAVSCNSTATAEISVNTNGTGPFDFDWNNDTYDGLQTLTDIPAGFYAVTVSDGNTCEAFADITITDPPVVTMDCAVVSDETAPGANNGQASFTFNDGTAPYEAVLTGPANQMESGLAANMFTFMNLPPGNYSLTVTDDNGCSADCMFTINTANCDLSIMLDTEDISCNGSADGTIEVIATDGTAPLSYDWSDDQFDGQSMLMDLPPGSYTVTVSDGAGCEAMASVDFTDPPAFDLNCTATTLPAGPLATDGILTVVVNDGPGGPYTVTFDNGAGTSGTITEGVPANTFVQNNLPSGMYTIMVSNAAGCEASCVIDLTALPCTLTLNPTPTGPNCNDSNDGTASVNPTDGPPPFVFDWSDNQFDGMDTATGLTAGQNISVIVTDAVGCIGTADFSLPSPTALDLDCSNIADPTTGMSSDGQADIAINGGTPPYMISWNGPVSGSDNLAMAGTYLIGGLTAGSYTVMIEDSNGCMIDCSFDLAGAICDLNLDLQGTSPRCAGEASGSLDLFIDGSFPIVTIDWNEDSFDGTEDHMNVPAGMFEVTVTDNQGCMASTSLTLVDLPALFTDCSQTTDPSTNISTDGEVNVVIAGGIAGYTISWMGPVNGNMMVATPGTFNINNLSAGSYTLSVEDNNGCTQTCDFVLNPISICTFDLAFTPTDETCPDTADGTALVEPNGGTPDYNYSWNNGVSTPSIQNLGTFLTCGYRWFHLPRQLL